MSAGVEELLMRVAEVAGRKLTWWQYDQTSWSAREWMPFALQRLSVQLWVALADEAQRAIGAASRGREGPRGNASGMGGSETHASIDSPPPPSLPPSSQPPPSLPPSPPSPPPIQPPPLLPGGYVPSPPGVQVHRQDDREVGPPFLPTPRETAFASAPSDDYPAGFLAPTDEHMHVLREEHQAMLATIDFFLGAAEPADSSIDWRHHEPPVLTPVKHQPGGTCWAFVATQQVESLAVIQLGKPLTELSTHQAWSCARAYNVTRGTPIECYLQNAWYLGPCYQDGWFCKCIPTGDSTDANPAVAWGYMQHVGGLATESDNPKDDSDKSCTVPTKPFVTVANLPKTRWGHTVIQPSTPCPWTFKLFYNYAQCHSNAEKQLRAAIQYSPVAISMSTHNIGKVAGEVGEELAEGRPARQQLPHGREELVRSLVHRCDARQPDHLVLAL